MRRFFVKYRDREVTRVRISRHPYKPGIDYSLLPSNPRECTRDTGTLFISAKDELDAWVKAMEWMK